MKKKEGFENMEDGEKDAGVAEKDDSESDKKFLKKLSKNEKSNKNIEEEPVTELETEDMDRNQADVEIKKMAEKFQGGIKLKEDDMKETPELNIDFRNTKYSEDKMSPQKKAQVETYELMNSIKNLESTIKGLSPVLNEGKKIMDMFEQYGLDTPKK